MSLFINPCHLFFKEMSNFWKQKNRPNLEGACINQSVHHVNEVLIYLEYDVVYLRYYVCGTPWLSINVFCFGNSGYNSRLEEKQYITKSV